MTSKLVSNFRKYRSRKLSGIGKRLRNLGITANVLTFFSLISGLLAIYYLFNNYSLFIIFTLLHFLFDSFDGVVARISKPTKFGKYFDISSDSLVTFLAVLKAGLHFNNYLGCIAAGLFLIAFIIHLRSKLKAPMIFLRTSTLLILIIISGRTFLYTETLLLAGYIIFGTISMYSIIRQVRWSVKR